MDTKNIIAAISLSAAVIILWALFFGPSTEEIKQNKINQEQVKQEQTQKSSDTPSLDQDENFSKQSRKEALAENERIEFENNNIIGTINTVGATIDDLTFKQYDTELNSNKKVTLLNPRKVENGYLIESGFVTNNKNIDVPNASTKWEIVGNKKLTDKNPIKLIWSNSQGITFEKNISLDDQFLFTIKEKIINASEKTYNFYSYAQIKRLRKPQISGFYILHEGFQAVLDDELIEEEIQIIVAAKRVKTIDGYAESLNINKFDLVIDFGVLYFLTKPMWFALDYFFKLLGNYGLAIIAVTVCIRLAVFPLANYSFRSMAKMKMLQPEMIRLKELHKGDKTKLQQETMALYKREKVNPMSGCLPIIPQIFIFFSLYKVLFVTIEMRHMPFFGWIKDLSDRDPTSVFNLFGLIPWDPPSFLLIGAWPIAMGISMWVQQKLNPTPPDPIQAKIFMFFPIFLTIILAPFPSGLVIYWTINNILTMLQQIVIMKRTTVKTV